MHSMVNRSSNIPQLFRSNIAQEVSLDFVSVQSNSPTKFYVVASHRWLPATNKCKYL